MFTIEDELSSDLGIVEKLLKFEAEEGIGLLTLVT